MKYFGCRLGLICGVLLSAFAAHATIDTSKLVKVTGEKSPKCVEYYNVKGEMYCSTEALQSKALDFEIVTYEKQNIKFDDRAWKLAWGKKTPSITTVEYVPKGDDIENWHELVTSQYMPTLQNEVTPMQFVKIILKGLEESGFKPITTFLKESPDQVIFEFKITAPPSQIQDEIQSIVKGKDGLYVLHYAIKVADMGQKRGDMWATNFSSSTIK